MFSMNLEALQWGNNLPLGCKCLREPMVSPEFTQRGISAEEGVQVKGPEV